MEGFLYLRTEKEKCQGGLVGRDRWRIRSEKKRERGKGCGDLFSTQTEASALYMTKDVTFILAFMNVDGLVRVVSVCQEERKDGEGKRGKGKKKGEKGFFLRVRSTEYGPHSSPCPKI